MKLYEISHTDITVSRIAYGCARLVDWDAAALDFNDVLKERPDDAKTREHLGEVYFLWGKSLAEATRAECGACQPGDYATFVSEVLVASNLAVGCITPHLHRDEEDVGLGILDVLQNG